MKNGIGIMLSIGKWGGIYFLFGKQYWSKRICLGWIAISIFPCDGDVILAMSAKSVGGDYPKTPRQFFDKSFLEKARQAKV